MTDGKKDYRTLFYRQGKIVIEEQNKEKPKKLPQATHLFLEETIRGRFTSKDTREDDFISHEEFDELRDELENLRNMLLDFSGQVEKNNVLNDAFKWLYAIDNVLEIQNLSKDKSLVLKVKTNDLSPTLFREIAEVEINLAKKYASFQIDIEPILQEEENHKSCE
jgi:hypothetical protein